MCLERAGGQKRAARLRPHHSTLLLALLLPKHGLLILSPFEACDGYPENSNLAKNS